MTRKHEREGWVDVPQNRKRRVSFKGESVVFFGFKGQLRYWRELDSWEHLRGPEDRLEQYPLSMKKGVHSQ